MNLGHYFLLLLLFLFLVHHSAQANGCPIFKCGNLGEVSFPFSEISNTECGFARMNCTADKPKVQFHKNGKWYLVDYINYSNQSILIRDEEVEKHLKSNKCDLLSNFPHNDTSPLSLKVSFSHPFFKCKRPYPNSPPNFFKTFSNYTSCTDYDLYFYDNYTWSLPSLPEKLSESCSVIHSSSRLGGIDLGRPMDHMSLLWATDFTLTWNVSNICMDCYSKGRICQLGTNNILECPKLPRDANIGLKVGIGVGTGVGGVLMSILCFILYQRRKKSKFSSSSTLISRELSSNHSNIPDPEKGSIYFKTPIFTYKELDEATNHFDSKKELGDGGFGTVYHGKLRDGRVVAVKRLFEHNYKRVDQFMNEIAILSGLRHRNLVSLYGCTSRHSRELLLVYEYVPNGTVADHLHGDRATACQLTWPIRLTIAIESADALAYLHASQIIHRDVKTNNILLDNGFHVKVADFGLSRLFPENVTHVSTAPQGTPGYVDPEYYQCYQLNDKSDVYSFGVVLIELISSKPAVDIGRHRHEINLANMAVNKIQHQALHELVDLSLGFDSDYNVRDRITLVAELAFRCLQQEKEMRPCMIEVLETLRGIQSEEYKKKKSEEIDTSADARLLKNSPLSPVSVTDKWASRSTTPNTSS